MPELPEVESIVRDLRDARPSLVGRRVEQVQVVWDGVVSGISSAELRRQLVGAEFSSVGRHGKYLLLDLRSGSPRQGHRRYLIIHLRMTGRLWLVPASEAVEHSTRLSLILDQGLALRFDDQRKFGRVWLVDDPVEVIGKLGPDALTVSFPEFRGQLTGYRRQLKPLLLDQSCVAGIGNIYADESLHRSGLNPLCNSGDLSEADLVRLHAAVISVLEEAVAARGANIDGVFKAGEFHVAVYGREGEPCPACGSAIVKTRVGQRGTHFCPRCQSL
jgi:formamidopyrimidine-DNA glycosylase